MSDRPAVENLAAYEAFTTANPSVDFLRADLLAGEGSALYQLEGIDIGALRRVQRLLRIDPDERVARCLLRHGFDSAQDIIALPRTSFVEALGDELEDGGEGAKRLYDRALTVKTRAMHMAAGVHSLVASRYFRSMRVNHVPAEVAERFQNLASYDEMFGSLDYCECEECGSILSPAAYLVDLLRILDKAVTVPNEGIPGGLKFDERRPDIGALPLTCANTNDEVPYLQIVNEALEQLLAGQLSVEGGDAVYRTLAETLYPFDLPFNLHLARIRRYLGSREASLERIYASFRTEPELSPPEAREALRLTAEQMGNLAPPDAAHLLERIEASYALKLTPTELQGLNELDTFAARVGMQSSEVKELLRQGLGAEEIVDTTGSYAVSEGKPGSLDLVQEGSTVTGTYGTGGTVEGLIDGLVLSGTWSEPSGGGTATGSFSLSFDPAGAGFAGEWLPAPGSGSGGAWKGTRTGGATSAGVLPHSLFVNHVLPVREYLRLVDETTGEEVVKIAAQGVATLDTLSRFLRLGRALGWAWGDLDWTLTTLCPPDVDSDGNITCAAELDEATLVELAKVAKLVDEHGLPLRLATALWFDLKTTGRGDGAESQAPYDQVFNSAAVLAQSAGRTVYRPTIDPTTSKFPNPLYGNEVESWTLGSGAETSAGGLIVAAIPGEPAALQAIAAALFGTGATVDLTVPNLSALYRHMGLASHLGLSGAEYLMLLELLGLAEPAKLPPVLSPGEALEVLGAAAWIASSSLGVKDVDDIVSGGESAAGRSYEPAALPAFLRALAEAVKPTLISAASFESPLVAEPAAAAIEQALVDQGFVDAVGIAVGDPAQRPDLSAIADYAPAVGALSEAQAEDAIDRLAAARTKQEAALATQLGPLLGLSPELATGIAAGVGRWRRAASPLAPFLSAALFGEPAAAVIAEGALDPKLVAKAFAAHQQPLAGALEVEPLSVASWRLTGTEAGKPVSFHFVTSDRETVSVYLDPAEAGDPAGLLFHLAAAEVLVGGELDPGQATKAFADQKPARTIAGAQVETLVQPRAWELSDPATGVRYGATQAEAGSEVLFTAPSGVAAEPPAAISEFVELMSQAGLLMSGLGLSGTAMAAIFAEPSAFGIVGDETEPLSFSREGVRGACVYMQLRSTFGDSGDRLAAYLASEHEIGDLCALTGWNPKAAADLCVAVFGDGGRCETVDDVARLERLFALADAVFVDVYTLTAIDAAREMKVAEAGWETSKALADGLLQARAAATPFEQWAEALLALEAPIESARRDSLVGTALWKVNQRFSDISTSRGLYEYLLLDIEMSGCARISRVREALNATQLYLQRCRLNLERGVTISTDNLPEVWWEWLLDFRVWQANREVFLYPENYIDPGLRTTATKPFQDLQNNLLQGPITDDAVGEAFHKYLDAFSEIARLVPVDSYRAVVHDAEKGEVNTLFVFSRTVSQPYQFYLASREEVAECEGGTGEVWSEWLPIEATINSPYITPVYAFNRLYVLWVELQEKKEPDGSKDPTGRYPVTQATVKLTYRTPSGKWMQPQTLVSEQVVNVEAAGIHGRFVDLYEEMEALWWNKVAAICVTGEGSGSAARAEKLCVYYGPLLDSAETGTLEPKQPEPNPEALEFFDAMRQAETVREQIKVRNSYGRVPMNPTLVLDANLYPTSLDHDGQYVMLRPDSPTETNPPTFRPSLNGSTLAVQADRETVFNQYAGGTSSIDSRIIHEGTPVGATDLESGLIPEELATEIFTAISTPPNELIDSSTGLVVERLMKGLSTRLLLKIISPVGAGITLAMARQVRETLLVHLYGSPQLFTGASTQSAIVAPTRNHPGAFLYSDGSETFLIDVSVAGTAFPLVSAELNVGQPFVAAAPGSFVGRDINLEMSRGFYELLTEPQTDLIDPKTGSVDVTKVEDMPVGILEKILLTDLGRAQEVRAQLLSGAGPAELSYQAGGSQPDDTVYSLEFGVTRLSTSAVQGLEHALFAGGIGNLLELERQQIPLNPELPFSRLRPAPGPPPASPEVSAPSIPYGDQVEFGGPFGNYYWELFFHAPFLVAKTLRDNQRFEEAEKWLQYVFNPTLPPDPLTASRFAEILPADIEKTKSAQIYAAMVPKWIDPEGWVVEAALKATVSEIQAATSVDEEQAEDLRNLLLNRYLAKPATGGYWRFEPFRVQGLESLEEELQNCAEIAAYNDEPFEPHAIARLRIGAYEKAIVMAYVGNLLDWGDQEFTRYTWESVTTAQMLYSYAYDLLGPRPQDLGSCGPERVVTFDQIRARYASSPKGIPQFLIDLENALAGGQADGPMLSAAAKPFNELHATFCVPENQQLVEVWDRVEDRLYKIRHCMNIAGQAEPLALWDPPLNPADLVRAQALGGFSGLQGQLQPSVPNYRFEVMIERAESLTETVRSFGAALLAALERRDAEGLALVRAGQELGVLKMVTATKKATIEGLEAQIASLQEGVDGAGYRASYYADLIAAGLSDAEIAALALNSAALYAHGTSIPIYGLSIGGYLAPNIFGFADGGFSIGDAINAGASISSTVAEMLGQSATIAQVAGENQRRESEWKLQRQTAEYELAGLREQIAATSTSLAAAKQDLALNAQEIANASRVEGLLRTNFTNQQLYAWMTGRIATVYFQAFRLAQDLALAAQTSYQFELDRDDEFVVFGNWEELRQGLLAGDGLLLGLEQMKKSYLEANTRPLEIEKTISLRQTFPAAFAGFKWGYEKGSAAAPPGQLDFTLSEALFDFDYPGHFDRRIKSVSVSLPSVIGPYQDFHLTLTQNTNLVVSQPNANAVDYANARTAVTPPGAMPTPPAGSVRENWAPNQSIAVSRGAHDSGLFALDFRDERYLPFEGTGAVSSWSLSMPPETNRIDFDNVSDVILKVHYTARDGGGAFASQVRSLYAKAEERYAYLSAATYELATAFSAEWRALLEPPIKGTRTLTFPVDSSAVLPNLGEAALHGVILQLELADGVAISDGGNPFLSLQVSGTPAQPLPIEITNNYGELTPQAIKAAKLETGFAGVEWSLQFDTTGAFDLSKLANVSLAVVYSAKPFSPTS